MINRRRHLTKQKGFWRANRRWLTVSVATLAAIGATGVTKLTHAANRQSSRQVPVSSQTLSRTPSRSTLVTPNSLSGSETRQSSSANASSISDSSVTSVSRSASRGLNVSLYRLGDPQDENLDEASGYLDDVTSNSYLASYNSFSDEVAVDSTRYASNSAEANYTGVNYSDLSSYSQWFNDNDSLMSNYNSYETQYHSLSNAQNHLSELAPVKRVELKDKINDFETVVSGFNKSASKTAHSAEIYEDLASDSVSQASDSAYFAASDFDTGDTADHPVVNVSTRNQFINAMGDANVHYINLMNNINLLGEYSGPVGFYNPSLADVSVPTRDLSVNGRVMNGDLPKHPNANRIWANLDVLGDAFNFSNPGHSTISLNNVHLFGTNYFGPVYDGYGGTPTGQTYVYNNITYTGSQLVCSRESQVIFKGNDAVNTGNYCTTDDSSGHFSRDPIGSYNPATGRNDLYTTYNYNAPSLSGDLSYYSIKNNATPYDDLSDAGPFAGLLAVAQNDWGPGSDTTSLNGGPQQQDIEALNVDVKPNAHLSAMTWNSTCFQLDGAGTANFGKDSVVNLTPRGTTGENQWSDYIDNAGLIKPDSGNYSSIDDHDDSSGIVIVGNGTVNVKDGATLNITPELNPSYQAWGQWLDVSGTSSINHPLLPSSIIIGAQNQNDHINYHGNLNVNDGGTLNIDYTKHLKDDKAAAENYDHGKYRQYYNDLPANVVLLRGASKINASHLGTIRVDVSNMQPRPYMTTINNVKFPATSLVTLSNQSTVNAAPDSVIRLIAQRYVPHTVGKRDEKEFQAGDPTHPIYLFEANLIGYIRNKVSGGAPTNIRVVTENPKLFRLDMRGNSGDIASPGVGIQARNVYAYDTEDKKFGQFNTATLPGGLTFHDGDQAYGNGQGRLVTGYLPNAYTNNPAFTKEMNRFNHSVSITPQPGYHEFNYNGQPIYINPTGFDFSRRIKFTKVPDVYLEGLRVVRDPYGDPKYLSGFATPGAYIKIYDDKDLVKYNSMIDPEDRSAGPIYVAKASPKANYHGIWANSRGYWSYQLPAGIDPNDLTVTAHYTPTIGSVETSRNVGDYTNAENDVNDDSDTLSPLPPTDTSDYDYSHSLKYDNGSKDGDYAAGESFQQGFNQGSTDTRFDHSIYSKSLPFIVGYLAAVNNTSETVPVHFYQSSSENQVRFDSVDESNLRGTYNVPIDVYHDFVQNHVPIGYHFSNNSEIDEMKNYILGVTDNDVDLNYSGGDLWVKVSPDQLIGSLPIMVGGSHGLSETYHLNLSRVHPKYLGLTYHLNFNDQSLAKQIKQKLNLPTDQYFASQPAQIRVTSEPNRQLILWLNHRKVGILNAREVRDSTSKNGYSEVLDAKNPVRWLTSDGRTPFRLTLHKKSPVSVHHVQPQSQSSQPSHASNRAMTVKKSAAESAATGFARPKASEASRKLNKSNHSTISLDQLMKTFRGVISVDDRINHQQAAKLAEWLAADRKLMRSQHRTAAPQVHHSRKSAVQRKSLQKQFTHVRFLMDQPLRLHGHRQVGQRRKRSPKVRRRYRYALLKRRLFSYTSRHHWRRGTRAGLYRRGQKIRINRVIRTRHGFCLRLTNGHYLPVRRADVKLLKALI